MRIGLVLAPMAALSACAADQATKNQGQIGANGAHPKRESAAATGCTLAEPTLESLIALHRCGIANPRPIDRAVTAAAAAAEAACGGPVVLYVEGDPADYGSDPSDYTCLPR